MDKCITRKISLIKSKKFFIEEYEIVETNTHVYTSEHLEILKNSLNQYVSHKNPKIFCMYCGRVLESTVIQ